MLSALGLPTALGVAAFAISLILAAVKIWETFFRHSRFEVDITWAGSKRGPVLEFSVINVGWKKDSVRAVNFRTRFPKKDPADKREWLEWEIGGPTWLHFPIVLDVDEVTPRTELPMWALTGGLQKLASEMQAGTAQIVVINARSSESYFPIPEIGKGPRPPTPEDLRA